MQLLRTHEKKVQLSSLAAIEDLQDTTPLPKHETLTKKTTFSPHIFSSWFI